VFFEYAQTNGYCTDNPIAKVKKANETKEANKPVGILTPEQVRALLTNAAPELVPCLAIGAFAGLRTAEIARLDWKEINLNRKFIEVSARKSKTASRRLVTIRPNLRSWLNPIRRKQGSVIPQKLSELVKAARIGAGIDEWPHNALRHSYTSYHLAKFKDANALALQLGHTTTKMLFKHYREVVSPQEAQKYWMIVPKAHLV
jgi:integrase